MGLGGRGGGGSRNRTVDASDNKKTRTRGAHLSEIVHHSGRFSHNLARKGLAVFDRSAHSAGPGSRQKEK